MHNLPFGVVAQFCVQRNIPRTWNPKLNAFINQWRRIRSMTRCHTTRSRQTSWHNKPVESIWFGGMRGAIGYSTQFRTGIAKRSIAYPRIVDYTSNIALAIYLIHFRNMTISSTASQHFENQLKPTMQDIQPLTMQSRVTWMSPCAKQKLN